MMTKALRQLCCVLAVGLPLAATAQQPVQSPRGAANAHDLRKVPASTAHRMVRFTAPVSPRADQNAVRVARGLRTQDRLNRQVAVTSPRVAQSFPLVASNARSWRGSDTLVARD